MRTFSQIVTKQLSKSIKIVLSSGFHIPSMFSQITIVISLAANGSIHDLVLSIPAPALPSLLYMEYSGAANSNFNLASPSCPPRPSSEILVKAFMAPNSYILLDCKTRITLMILKSSAYLSNSQLGGPQISGFFDGWCLSVLYLLPWNKTVLLLVQNSISRSTCYVCLFWLTYDFS